jgi:limonene-1,2-epoxide hydrolase
MEESEIMTDPIKTVTAFLGELIKGKEGGKAALRRYFMPDTIWEMVGVGVMVGPEDAIAVMDREYDAMGVTKLQVDILSIAAAGNTVFTERVDRMLTEDGRELRGARLVGVFEVEGDKIRATREYFDTAGLYARQTGQNQGV